MFRQKTLQELAKKKRKEAKKDSTKRVRNKCINFRLTPTESEVLNRKIELSGLLKQEYIIKCLLDHKVEIQKDFNLADRLAKEIFQLARVIKKYGVLEEDEQEILLFVLEIYEQLKNEKAPK